MNSSRIVRSALALVMLAGCGGPDAASPSVLASSPAASASTPAAATGADPLPGSGRIEPGRYSIERSSWTPAPFALTMPVGWVAQNGGQTITKHPDESEREISWSVSIVDRLFADPCGPNDTIEIGPTADDLVTAVLDLPGPRASEPQDITLGGLPGKSIELTVPPDLDESQCDPPIGLQIWLDRPGGKYLLIGKGVPTRIYTVDTDGGRFIVVVQYRPTTAPDDLAEFEAIIDSIEFES